jgi:NAD(P)-dependent dehydrogenase (short-subunit alcohol dehydrogenase family)
MNDTPSAELRVALVTGAGSGIGRRTAVALGRAGFSVVLADLNENTAQEAAGEVVAAGARASVVLADVSDADSVRSLFEQVREEFGRLDVLFNNAGIGAPRKPLEDLSDDEWQSCVDTNVSGVFYCIREAFRLMKDQDPRGGRIINNGSISAHVPRPDAAPYNATKAAVCGLTKSAAVEGRKYDIACGQIDIGNALTKQTYKVEEGMMQANGSMQPEPTIDPDDVADAVVYMANLPLSTNVLSLTVMATKMPYVGRG